MPASVANLLVLLLAAYVAAGLVFALPFIVRGVNRIDPAARESGWGFRLVILPGVVAFWPLLLRRSIGRRSPPEESNAHRRAARREETP